MFYGLYVGGGIGMPRAAREALAGMLGLKTGQANNIATFDDIFTSPILSKLAPGRIAQVAWYVVRGQSKERPDETAARLARLPDRAAQRPRHLVPIGPGREPASRAEAPT